MNVRKFTIMVVLILVLALVSTVSAAWAKPPAPGVPYDFVNIGDPDSEAGHNLYGWGPVEPFTHGGHWGGVIGESECEDGNCRVISSGYEDEYGTLGVENNLEDWASFTLNFGPGLYPKLLTLRALEGHAKDSFFVYIDSMENDPIYYWPGDDLTGEYWFTHTIPVRLNGKHTIYLLSDQEHWSGWDTFGQVAFTWAKAERFYP